MDPMTGQTSLDEIARRLQLAQAMAMRPQQYRTPVGSALGGLAQVLAARNANKLGQQYADTQAAQNKANVSALAAALGVPEDKFAGVSPEFVGNLASVYAQQNNPQEARTAKRTDGLLIYTTGPNAGQLVPGQDDAPRVDPNATLEIERGNLAARQRSNELAASGQEISRQENARQGSKLSAFSEKALGEATDAAIAAGQSRFELESLANDYLAIAPSAGAQARWSEVMKGVFGQEDATSVLRTRYVKMRNSEAVKNLPPGVASDRDIALALEGFLPPTANPETVASFLRGMSKLSAFDEAFNTFKAGYIDQNNGIRGLLSAWKGSDELKSLREGVAQPAPQADSGVMDELPDPSGLQDGQTATDTDTGDVYEVKGGKWVKRAI